MALLGSYPKMVYLNGSIVTSADAKISVFDRGFLFGDGVYEVMTCKNGNFFKADYHFKRLRRSLKELSINFSPDTIIPEIPKVLKASELENKDCLLYIQITRGIAPRQHAFPEQPTPSVLMYAWEKALPEINTALAQVQVQEEFRWSRCDIKSTSLLGNVLANQYAAAHDCYETLFYREGIITEASHCNVFFVKGVTVFTHPANNFILNGITRQVVLELCDRLDIPVQQTGLSKNELNSIDEAFLTGTSTQIMAISHIEDRRVGSGVTGVITKKLQEALRLEKLGV